MFLFMGGQIIGSAEAGVLPVPEVVQEQTQWCWAACSEAVIGYFGGSVNQCDLADDLRIANQWGDDQCCMYNFRDDILEDETDPPGDDYHRCNHWNYIFGGNLSIENILNTNNIPTRQEWRSLSANEIFTDINIGSPFVMRFGWTGGGGHFLVCRGIENQGNAANPMIFYMDPGPLTDNYQISDFNWVREAADHTWTHTLRVTQGSNPLPPAADIKINGFDGTFNANSSQNLNITISLDPREYTDNADWWVLGQYTGVLYSCDLNGNWSEGVTPIYQGRLGTLNNYPIYSGTLAPGTYTFYFGTDLDRDGIVNDPLYYDFVTVIVQ